VATDAELVAATVRGDRQAAGDLVERHAAAVYAVCLGLLADPDRAQDAAQDALLKALERLGSLREPATFRAWLISIARNLCRDSWKRTRRRRALLGGEAVRTAAAEAVPGMGAAATAPGDDAGPDLQAALARLPENHRLPLLLYYFDGLDAARVGTALGISRSGAGARICRARRALREILEVGHD
jgi:RNA polymerase sigma-70 factor (ECF subfamily)